MNVTYTYLQTPASAWITNLGPEINDPASASFAASSLQDGRLRVSNRGGKSFAGGLVARKINPPIVEGVTLSYGMLTAVVTIPDAALSNLARLETDFILVTSASPDPKQSIPNKFNGSTQLNLQTGHFEIDASSSAAHWSDIGSGPGTEIEPDTPHEMAIRYQWDFAQKRHSTLSIEWDGIMYPVPESMQNVGNQESNWDAVMAIQLQSEILEKGSTEVIYDDIMLTLSDEPL